ncbi:hypothetical protein D3C87_472270 [compost metagenome]
MIQLIRYAAITLSLLALPAWAADLLPPPVNGITFDEWAAGNARLADNQSLASVLGTLEVSEVKWNQANEAFTKALGEGDPGSHLFQRYGKVFANPAAGRYAATADQPRALGKLATFEDYASLQAHLEVAAEAGLDAVDVLKEHGLSVYEFSQEARPWVEKMARAAGGDGGFERMTLIRERYDAQYRQRYGLTARAAQ